VVKDNSASHTARCTRGWEVTHPGQLIQLIKGISHAIWCHIQLIKLGEEEGRGGHLEWWRLSSWVIFMHDGALLSWRWLNTHLLMGSGKWIPSFVLLTCIAFSSPIKLSLTHPTSFLTSTLLILSLIPPR